MFRFLEHKKSSDRLLLKLFLLVLFVATLWYVLDLNDDATTEVPGTGGTLVEGVIGTPGFINPVLALTRADRDVTALVYSGLLHLDENGQLAPQLAESVTISDNGLVYNVVLKPDTTFHDGTPITADDVVFTVGSIQTPNLRSPLQANFDGVKVEKISDRELNFVLGEPFVPFIENLTFGILPKHIWNEVSAEQFQFSQNNTEPIGSGPYQVTETIRNASGLIEGFELSAFESVLGRPNIDAITFKFYATEPELVDALNEGAVMSAAGVSPENIGSLNESVRERILTTPLPRTFTIFFNQNRSVALRDKAARAALSAAIDREALVEDVLDGYGIPASSPLPPGFVATTSSSTDAESSSSTPLEIARTLLEDGGWEQDEETGTWKKEIDDAEIPLTIDIATANTGTFTETAERIRETWTELGVEVVVRQFEQSDLTLGIIRPREYQALLFGTVVGRQLDFYSFWHSSGHDDPGYNISLYANITVDETLVTLRTETDPAERDRLYALLEREILSDHPAIFLYVPEFTYVVPAELHTAPLTKIANPHERFSNVEDWHINTESVWPIFNDEE